MSEQRNKRGPGICYNFQRGECNRGTSCRYLHDKQGEQSSTENYGRYGGGNSRRGVCYNFQRGECNRGDSCRYSHDGTKPPDRGNGSSYNSSYTRYKPSTYDSKYSRDRRANKEKSHDPLPEKPSWIPSPSPPGSWAAIVAADPPKNDTEVCDEVCDDNDAQVFDED